MPAFLITTATIVRRTYRVTADSHAAAEAAYLNSDGRSRIIAEQDVEEHLVAVDRVTDDILMPTPCAQIAREIAHLPIATDSGEVQ